MRGKCSIAGCDNLSRITKNGDKIYEYFLCDKHHYPIAVRRKRYRKAYLLRKKGKNYWREQKARIYARLRFKDSNICEVEGCDKVGQRHHKDYGNPFLIRWLCSQHHALIPKRVVL